MSGMGGGSVVGATPFVVVEAGHGVFLRPSLALGHSPTSIVPAETLGVARVDACLRLPGLYTTRRGLQLDGCGGGDFGFTRLQGTLAQTLPVVSLGPSVDFRGELGGDWAALLRGVFGVNLVRAPYDDSSGDRSLPPAWSARLELALSWRLQ